MTFYEAALTEPLVLRLWYAWLVGILLVTPLILLVFSNSRREGWVTLAAVALTAMVMPWAYRQVGYVKLLGLPHVIIWTPLVLYLIRRLRSGCPAGFPRRVAIVFVATLCVSLAFDYVDVARWLLGERGPMHG